MTESGLENPRQMQFADYLVDLALRVSNDCLRTVRVMTSQVSVSALQDLRNEMARIEACANLLTGCQSKTLVKPIIKQCASLDLLLLEPLRKRLRLATVEDLLLRTKKKKTQKALVLYREQLNNANIEIDFTLCQELLMAQSVSWRQMPISSAADAENKVFVDRYQRTYQKGRKLGETVLNNGQPEQHLCWCRQVRRLRLQLEIMRSVLGEKNKANRWYLEKLQQNLAELIALDDFENFADKLNHQKKPLFKTKDVIRLGSVSLVRRETLKRRGAKLYQGIYGPKVKAFGRCVSNDLKNLHLHKIVVLPKPAMEKNEQGTDKDPLQGENRAEDHAKNTS